MNIAVCDDERDFLGSFKPDLSGFLTNDSVFYYDEADRLSEDIRGGKTFGLVFLDIELGKGGNGIELAEKLVSLLPPPLKLYI